MRRSTSPMSSDARSGGRIPSKRRRCSSRSPSARMIRSFTYGPSRTPPGPISIAATSSGPFTGSSSSSRSIRDDHHEQMLAAEASLFCLRALERRSPPSGLGPDRSGRWRARELPREGSSWYVRHCHSTASWRATRSARSSTWPRHCRHRHGPVEAPCRASPAGFSRGVAGGTWPAMRRHEGGRARGRAGSSTSRATARAPWPRSIVWPAGWSTRRRRPARRATSFAISHRCHCRRGRQSPTCSRR